MESGTDEKLFIHISQQLDRASSLPLPAQLSASMRKLIDADILKQGDLIPSTRELSRRLNLSRSTVCQAYSRLKSEGYLRKSPGNGVIACKQIQNRLTGDELFGNICDNWKLSPTPLPTSGNRSETQPIDLTRPKPILSPFSSQEWHRLWLKHSRCSPSSIFETPNERLGSPRLRQAIARLLFRFRGIKTRPENIQITSDAVHELLAMGWLPNGRNRTTGIEESSPFQPAIQNLLENVISIPVDKDGAVADREALTRLDTLIVTPNHNFPFASVLHTERRARLLSWSALPGRALIEFDGDAMLNYGEMSPPSLYTMSGGGILHTGTFDQILGPGLGLSYIVIPDQLLDKVSQVGSISGLAPSSFIQELTASFIESGGFESHLRDTVRTLCLWREIFSTTLYRRLKENATCTGAAIGQFMSLALKKNVLKASNQTSSLSLAAVSELEKRGVRIKPLKENDLEAELLICFGHLSRSQLEHTVNTICDSLQSIYNVNEPPPIDRRSGIAYGDNQPLVHKSETYWQNSRI